MFKKSTSKRAFLKPMRRKFKSSLIRAEIQIVVTSFLLILLDFLRGSFIGAASEGDMTRILYLSGILVAVVLLKCWTFYSYSYHFRKYKTFSMAEIRREILLALLGRGFPSFLKKASGEYFAIYQSQVDRLGSQYYDSWYGVQQIIFEVLFALMSMLYISPLLCLAAVGLLLPGILLPESTTKRTKALSTKSVEAHNRLLARFRDRLKAFELIDNYGVQDAFDKVMQKDSETCRRAGLRTGLFNWFIVTGGQFLTAAAMVGFVLLAAWQLSAGRLSLAYFISATRLMSTLQGDSFYIASYVHIFVSSQSPMASVRDLLEGGDPPQVEKLRACSERDADDAAAADDVPNAPDSPDVRDVRVAFDQVSFAYPDEPGCMLFDHLSFSAQSPGLVLIRGASGSGKSTAMNLLLGCYPALNGKITVNGLPVEAGQYINDRITILRQEASFLSDTLLDNLTLYQKYDISRLERLLVDLGLEKFASSDALKQPVDRAAATLSGGEARRLMLVRSLLNPKPILILDEPLANLDAESMRLVTRLILEESKHRLIFLISHQVPEALREEASREIMIGA